MAERVNARLKDEFGASQIRVRGVAKVTAHLMFEVLAPTLDQWLRMAHSRLTTPQWKSNPPLVGPKTSEGRRRSSAQIWPLITSKVHLCSPDLTKDQLGTLTERPSPRTA